MKQVSQQPGYCIGWAPLLSMPQETWLRGCLFTPALTAVNYGQHAAAQQMPALQECTGLLPFTNGAQFMQWQDTARMAETSHAVPPPITDRHLQATDLPRRSNAGLAEPITHHDTHSNCGHTTDWARFKVQIGHWLDATLPCPPHSGSTRHASERRSHANVQNTG